MSVLVSMVKGWLLLCVVCGELISLNAVGPPDSSSFSSAVIFIFTCGFVQRLRNPVRM